MSPSCSSRISHERAFSPSSRRFSVFNTTLTSQAQIAASASLGSVCQLPFNESGAGFRAGGTGFRDHFGLRLALQAIGTRSTESPGAITASSDGLSCPLDRCARWLMLQSQFGMEVCSPTAETELQTCPTRPASRCNRRFNRLQQATCVAGAEHPNRRRKASKQLREARLEVMRDRKAGLARCPIISSGLAWLPMPQSAESCQVFAAALDVHSPTGISMLVRLDGAHQRLCEFGAGHGPNSR